MSIIYFRQRYHLSVSNFLGFQLLRDRFKHLNSKGLKPYLLSP